MSMKKFTLLLMSLLMVSIFAVAQKKLCVHTIYGEKIEYIASDVAYIDFEDATTEPDDDPVVPETGGYVAKPFSVSATKTVTFSPGNLQYHPANDEWRFAPSQLDYIGYDNENISPTYNGWIDLFGWGTGTNPTNISKDNADYQIFVDWGVNKIGNDAPNTWRTLTVYEWSYLIKYRPDASNLVGVAEVNGVNGLIFLPDAWVCPEGLIFKNGFHDNYGIKNYGEHQTISASDWSRFEANGAVFLPTAGIRYYGSGVSDVQYSADYWSATDIEFDNAFYLSFDSDEVYVGSYNRYGGRSVRLVKD